MLDRIDVDVIVVIVEIFLVHDRVFPEPALPDAAFTARDAAGAETFAFRHGAREACLDQRPARRVIRIAFRQPPKAVQVVGQDDDRFNVERMARADVRECFAQRIDMLDQQTISGSLSEVDGEEPDGSGQPCPAVVGHPLTFGRVGWSDAVRLRLAASYELWIKARRTG